MMARPIRALKRPRRSSRRGWRPVAPRSPDLADPDRPRLAERRRGRDRDAHRLIAVARDARARDLAAGDLQEGLQLGAIRRFEPGEEAVPAGAQGEGVGPEWPGRSVGPKTDRDRVRRPDELHPDVVSAGVVPGLGQGRQRAVRQPEDRRGGVDVTVLAEHLEAADRSDGIDRLDLLAGDEPKRIEIVDRRVAEESTGGRDVRLWRRFNVVRDQPDRINRAQLSGLDHPTRLDIPDVEA